jgi:hypothetical protein
MNFIIEADHFIFASNTPGNGTGPSKFSFLINAAAGTEYIRILFLDMRVQKLDSEEPKQWWNGFGMDVWGK